MVDFKGSHYPKDVILYAVFFYVRYAVSYRDLEEIMAERGVTVDHATLNAEQMGREIFAPDCLPGPAAQIRNQQLLADGRDLYPGQRQVDLFLSGCRQIRQNP
jgi:putative transposase